MKQSTVTMNQPIAAVISTMYGRDDLHYFRQSLDSMLGQSYPQEKLRLYLYVDGPVPELHERFLEQNAMHFYRIVRGEENRGLSYGLNQLIDCLEDESIVLRMDMDDLAHSSRVERQVAMLEANPRISLIGCNSWEIDESGGVVSQRDYPASPAAIREGIARGNPMLHPSYCMRRTLLTTHGMRYRELYLNEDLGFLFDVLERGLELANLQERLMYWRVTDKFFERRHFRRHFIEYRAYVQGIQAVHGLSTKQIYPLIRLVFRLLPNGFARHIYRSSLRNNFLRG
ncbi:glycosyltransferase [Granulosicoccus antarcticus]|uniref:Glycosyltransferase EpsE n=1 Tax=Granulosicoccus antarcticus IMCC3135 TaxID=1192854 RepID=A0A2Z2NMP1_9GAMM|nr:glycosyltransferase [Granulosicoccus antarcticus]ASJ70998.1 Putative glycosyltransferase EpsE [Granulosicoccus antarcticus IMCC3135]